MLGGFSIERVDGTPKMLELIRREDELNNQSPLLSLFRKIQTVLLPYGLVYLVKGSWAYIVNWLWNYTVCVTARYPAKQNDHGSQWINDDVNMEDSESLIRGRSSTLLPSVSRCMLITVPVEYGVKEKVCKIWLHISGWIWTCNSTECLLKGKLKSWSCGISIYIYIYYIVELHVRSGNEA